jgi:phosphinothricin acetyltransferase
MATRVSEGIGDFPWLVYVIDGSVVGYAYAAHWRPRTAYRYTAESTIYIHPDSTRRGYGRSLYSRLVKEIRARGFRTAIGTIALPNDASVALHESLGFRKSGVLKRAGWKHELWVDVGYWQIEFESGE